MMSKDEKINCKYLTKADLEQLHCSISLALHFVSDNTFIKYALKYRCLHVTHFKLHVNLKINIFI